MIHAEYDLILMSLVIFVPTAFAVVLLFFPRGSEEYMKWWSLLGTAVTLVISMWIFIDFRHDRITIFRSRGERAPAGFVTIPVKIVQGLLVAPVRVGSLRATAIIDTGGQSSLANEAFRMAISRRIAPKDVLSDAITSDSGGPSTNSLTM